MTVLDIAIHEVEIDMSAPDVILYAFERIERGEVKQAVFVIADRPYDGASMRMMLTVGIVWDGDNETWRQTFDPSGDLKGPGSRTICAGWEERQDSAFAASRTTFRLATLAAMVRGKVHLQRYVPH